MFTIIPSWESYACRSWLMCNAFINLTFEFIHVFLLYTASVGFWYVIVGLPFIHLPICVRSILVPPGVYGEIKFQSLTPHVYLRIFSYKENERKWKRNESAIDSKTFVVNILQSFSALLWSKRAEITFRERMEYELSNAEQKFCWNVSHKKDYLNASRPIKFLNTQNRGFSNENRSIR